MNKNYIFNSDQACKYGVEAAVLLSNLTYWINKNKANGKHYYEGRHWTYNSVAAFEKLFPFWNKDKIRRLLEKLVDEGAIVKGNFNKAKFDKTNWYSVTVELADLPNGVGRSEEPIPDINTDSKPDSKKNINKKEFHPSQLDIPITNGTFEDIEKGSDIDKEYDELIEYIKSQLGIGKMRVNIEQQTDYKDLVEEHGLDKCKKAWKMAHWKCKCLHGTPDSKFNHLGLLKPPKLTHDRFTEFIIAYIADPREYTEETLRKIEARKTHGF
jgi:hypothetical protein